MQVQRLLALLDAARALRKSGRKDEAEQACREALRIAPDSERAHCELGNLFFARGSLEEAEAAYRAALERAPRDAEARFRLGNALKELGRLAEAAAAYREVLAAHPKHHAAHSNLIFLLDLMPEFDTAAQQAERRRWHDLHARSLAAGIAPFSNRRDAERRLRIGLVSSDFREHAAAKCFGPVLRHHDRSAFEMFCYDSGRIEDAVTRELRAAAEGWCSAADLPDEALAARIRSDGVDVLVDLSGHTNGSRLLVFARKPAPVQISGWGHVNGTGLPTVDYLVSDATLIPAALRGLFAEQIADLPCFLCYEPFGEVPPVAPLPSLARGSFTFGSKNRPEKISEATLALWSRILHAVPQSRLVLQSLRLGKPAREEIRRRFAEHGIAAERLTLLGAVDNHLRVLDDIDLALDPFPNNGMITTAEALWMGVPVLTLAGSTPAGRAGAAILSAAGMPDWIARDEAEYVRIAAEFAEEREFLARLRATLRERLAQTPVFDGRACAAAAGALFRRAWRRWCDNPPPGGAT